MSKTLDEWAGLALTGILANNDLNFSAIPDSEGVRKSIVKAAFDIAEAMQKESQKRNQSYINKKTRELTE